MVIVTWSMLCLASSSTCSRQLEAVGRHAELDVRRRSASCRKVSKVRAGIGQRVARSGDAEHAHLRDRRRDRQHLPHRLIRRQQFGNDARAATRWRSRICDCSSCTGCCTPAPPRRACARSSGGRLPNSRGGPAPWRGCRPVRPSICRAVEPQLLALQPAAAGGECSMTGRSMAGFPCAFQVGGTKDSATAVPASSITLSH
jgi:hypothetical protein